MRHRRKIEKKQKQVISSLLDKLINFVKKKKSEVNFGA
jgi:hypothetical protein